MFLSSLSETFWQFVLSWDISFKIYNLLLLFPPLPFSTNMLLLLSLVRCYLSHKKMSRSKTNIHSITFYTSFTYILDEYEKDILVLPSDTNGQTMNQAHSQEGGRGGDTFVTPTPWKLISPPLQYLFWLWAQGECFNKDKDYLEDIQYQQFPT